MSGGFESRGRGTAGHDASFDYAPPAPRRAQPRELTAEDRARTASTIARNVDGALDGLAAAVWEVEAAAEGNRAEDLAKYRAGRQRIDASMSYLAELAKSAATAVNDATDEDVRAKLEGVASLLTEMTIAIASLPAPPQVEGPQLSCEGALLAMLPPDAPVARGAEATYSNAVNGVRGLIRQMTFADMTAMQTILRQHPEHEISRRIARMNPERRNAIHADLADTRLRLQARSREAAQGRIEAAAPAPFKVRRIEIGSTAVTAPPVADTATEVPARPDEPATPAAPARSEAADDQARAAQAGERAPGGEPLPGTMRAGLEPAVGGDLGGVHVHTDAHAAQLAAAEGAHAVSIGEDVFMGAGAYRPDSEEGQALIAHEAAHVIEQRSSGPGVHRAEIGLVAAVTSEMTADQKAQAYLAEHKNEVNARAYVQRNRGHVFDELIAVMGSRDVPTGHPGLAWTDPGAFLWHVVDRLKIGGPDTFVERLRSVIAPVDLWSLVDQQRLLTKVEYVSDDVLTHDMKKRLDSARGDYGGGPVGPARWIPAVGTALASAIESSLLQAVIRMGPKFFHAARLKQREATQRGADTEPVTLGDLVPAHPMDWTVAGALCERDIIHVTAGPEDIAEGAPDPNRNRKIQFEWQGPRGLWNYVKVTRPADPSPEEVAKNVLGNHALAYRLVVAPPLYGIPEDLAENIEEARAYRPSALGSRPATADAPIEHDPLVALGGSAAGDEAALAAATRALDQRAAAQRAAGGQNTNEAGAAAEREGDAAGPAASPVDRQPLLDAIGTSQVQVQALASIVEPFALQEQLAPVRAWLATKRTELLSVPDDTVKPWAEVLRGQQHVLLAISADLNRLATQLQEPTKDDPWAGTVGLSPMHREIFMAYLRAAAVAHIPEAGMAALAEARAKQVASIPASLEAMLAQAIGKVEAMRAVAGEVSREQQASREVFGMGIAARHHDLMRQVADLRFKLRLGQVDAAEVQRLHGDCDALVFEAEILANLGMVRQATAVIEKLQDDGWVAAAGQVEDLETYRETGHHLKMFLGRMHSRYIALTQRAVTIADGMRAGNMREADATNLARTLVTEAMADIRADQERLASNTEVTTFLQRAYDEIEDAQQKAMILQIAVFIGVTIVSSVVGAGAGAVAGTMLRGVQGARLIAGAATMVVESASMSGIQAALTGDSFVEAMTLDLGQNLLTMGALKAFDNILEGTKLGATLARGGAKIADDAVEGAAKASKLAYVGAKGVELSGRVLIIAGTQIAGMQAEAAIKEGRAMTMDQIVAEGASGIAMMVGTGVLTRLAARPIDKITKISARAADLHMRGKQLEKLAHKVEESGDPAEALDLLRQDRELIEAELAEYQKLAEATPADLQRLGLSPDMVEAWKMGAAQHLADVDAMTSGHVAATLGLDTIVPGRTYSGPSERVQAVVADYTAKGFNDASEMLPEGNQRHTLTSPDGRTTIEVVSTVPDKATGPNAAQIEAFADMAEAVVAEPPALQAQVDGVTGVRKGPAYEEAQAQLRDFYTQMEREAQSVTPVGGQARDGAYAWQYGYDAQVFSHGLANIVLRIHLVTEPNVTAANVAHLHQQVTAGVDRHYNFRHSLVGPDGASRRLHVEVVFQDAEAGSHVTVTALAGNGLDADVTRWYVEGDPTTHAHEVGHALGHPDEYYDWTGRAPDRAHPQGPGVTHDNSLMGDYWIDAQAGVVDPSTTLRARHLDRMSQELAPAMSASAMVASMGNPIGGAATAMLGYLADVGRTGVAPPGPRRQPSPADPVRQEDGSASAHDGRVIYKALDAQGRATGVEGTLVPSMYNQGTKANDRIEPPGWKGQGTLHNQARGHLLAKILGGSGDIEHNLVTLEQNWTNSPVMRDFELDVAQALRGGETIKYASTPLYDGDNPIPRGVTIVAEGDQGFQLSVTILNPQGRTPT